MVVRSVQIRFLVVVKDVYRLVVYIVPLSDEKSGIDCRLFFVFVLVRRRGKKSDPQFDKLISLCGN